MPDRPTAMTSNAESAKDDVLARSRSHAGPRTREHAIAVTESAHCTRCGPGPVDRMPFSYAYGGAVFPAARCARCGLVFLRERPGADDLTALYSAEYFTADYRCGHATRGALEGSASSTGDRVLLDMIERATPLGHLLEIGAAGGDFLVAARARGWKVTGVELSDVAARSARQRFGLDIRTGSLRDAQFMAESFDVVYMGDVLEHVPDPAEDLREVWRILRSRGVVVIAGPTTINSLARRAGLLLYRLRGGTKVLRAPPYHLWEFTPSTLRGLVTSCGFHIIEQRPDKIPPHAVTKRCGTAGVLLWPVEAMNWIITRVAGVWGDRLILLAEREENP